MATLVLQYAGQALGTALGGPVGAALGRAAGAIAGNLVDQALFGGTRRAKGPRLADLQVMSSSEGADLPRVWGRMRVAGQVIWATSFEEVKSTSTEKASAKGGPSTKVTEYLYYANFAVALCEGEIDRIGRAWADGKAIDLSEITCRIYAGTETQEPDSLIVAKEGATLAPAYRGTAYIVFERLPLGDFGNRLPQFSFEVIRGGGDLAAKIRAVTVIPGSTEFGYDTAIVTRRAGRGVTESENAHASALRSDWSVSLDDLTATCRRLDSAALVVAWFGTDLRCGSCNILPGVEDASKATEGADWLVTGLSRSEAHLVSRHVGAASHGGTPSDASVLRALVDLKSRGLKPVFYPFLLMDIPSGNGLADPHGGTAQGAYPWRGRITASVAPGRAGTPDGTAAAAAEIAAFLGQAQAGDFTAHKGKVAYRGPEDWGYRRMILHYAHLCALAGGVEAFLIGSELRGLTTLRDAPGSYPFVAALAQLAGKVKAILPDAKITYAADWSEFPPHRPADEPDGLYFHLDRLWTSDAIDVIGIDNYLPLADWRDGEAHLDRQAGHDSPYDLAYLSANISGGEGFDWYYAGDADRARQRRSAIADTAYGKDWMFRTKDFAGWWSNLHHDRSAGVESPAPTAWVPQSKPIWFTEAGCPAVDKGANQPNVFVDSKSSESLLPYFSDGRRDDLMQHRALTALLDHWRSTGAHNPVSSIYGGPMVDAARIYVWSWDARPFPYFPANENTWADGVNFATGHWLNGRLSSVSLARLIADICADYGCDAVDASGVEGLIDGFLIDRSMSARAALEDLLSAFAIDAVESDGQLAFRSRSRAGGRSRAIADPVESEPDAELFQVTRAQESELPAALRMTYLDSGLDYRSAAVEARRLLGRSAAERQAALPAALSQEAAQAVADTGLQESWAGRDRLALGLGLRQLALEPGDVALLDTGAGARAFRIETIVDGAWRKVEGRSHDATVYAAAIATARTVPLATARLYGEPDVLLMDLPVTAKDADPQAPWLAASAAPWPGALAVYRQSGDAGLVLNRTLSAEATMGVLLDDLPAGPRNVFDRATRLRVLLDHGALSAASEAALLDGQNVAAIGDAETGFEILQFAAAELVAADTYAIGTLLRAQSGSAPEMLARRRAGSRFVLLNQAVVQPQLAVEEAGLPIGWRIGPAQYDASRAHVAVTQRGRMLGLRPQPPCHVTARRVGSGLLVSWIRCTRIDGDSWDLAEVPLGEDSEAYEVAILRDGVTLRVATVASPAYAYGASDIADDFGDMPPSLTLRLCQISETYGRGAMFEGIIHV